MKYRSLFISDVHLGSKKCRADELIEFLKQHDFETIYILGDLFDIWQMKSKRYWPQRHTDLVRKLLKRSKNSKIVYIIGNHDEFLSSIFLDVVGSWGNICICERADHVTVSGKKYLLIHGHQFDAVTMHAKWVAVIGDKGYELLIVLNRLQNKVRKFFKIRYWSLSGWVKRTVKDAVKYISNYEHAAVRFAKKDGYDGIMCGHIHSPAIKEIDHVEYYNSGDWVDSCSALIEDYDGKLFLYEFEITN